MIKIAVFINPKGKVKKKILNFKKIVKNNFGYQLYLSHQPHCTIFTMNVSKSILKSKNKLKNIKIKPFIKNVLVVKKTGLFLNDPITNGQTIYFKINKNSFLNTLQLELLKLFNKFKNNKIKTKFKLAWMNKNNNKYGYPFVGKNWLPHFTIASFANLNKKNKFIKNFLNKKIIYRELINKVYIYKINGNKHKYLWSMKIN